MSMRSDYELTVKLRGDAPCPEFQDAVRLWIASLDWEVEEVPVDGEPPESDYFQFDDDGRGFYMHLYEVHPYAIDPAKIAISVPYTVDAYSHEPTECSEAGTEQYVVIDGKPFTYPQLLLIALQRVFAGCRVDDEWRMHINDVRVIEAAAQAIDPKFSLVSGVYRSN